MDMKEDEVTETYPTIFFAVNDFQEMLQDITVSEEGELVSVLVRTHAHTRTRTRTHITHKLTDCVNGHRCA
jgi:hypothetical protein